MLNLVKEVKPKCVSHYLQLIIKYNQAKSLTDAINLAIQIFALQKDPFLPICTHTKEEHLIILSNLLLLFSRLEKLGSG